MTQQDDTIRDTIRESYGAIASEQRGGCCGDSEQSGESRRDAHAIELGYANADLEQIPGDANLGLGCGNPTAIAKLQEGDTVLDLGSGAGMDAFLAAEQVGKTGRVIGVDMTPEMLGRARVTAAREGLADRVEFREGLIEELPVVDESIDVIISNCVINLSPDKPGVFAEAFRVLKSGGRLAVSDICLTEPLPSDLKEAAASHVACIGGAAQADDYLQDIEVAGFVDVSWTRSNASAIFESLLTDPLIQDVVGDLGEDALDDIRDSIWSYRVEAHKP
jgi:SAM-dependent methyltransferase